MSKTAFDDYAGEGEYDRALEESLEVSGEGKEFFARGRVVWAASWLKAQQAPSPARVLDYGCGVGDTAPLLHSEWGARTVVGVDESAACIRAAVARHPLHTFTTVADHQALQDFDAAYVNGVLHHVPLAQRADVVQRIARSLRPGGRLFLFDNSPWNPGTRFVMSRCRFDDDAVMMWPHQARRLMRSAGFHIEKTAFLFVFPRPLSALRALEPALERAPLGAQYVVVGRA